jgi:hypothetical protein
LSALSRPVFKGIYTVMLGAMGATEHHPTGRFDAMPDNPAAAMGAGRGEGVDGALEAVKRVGFAAHNNLKTFIILVAANFTYAHDLISPIAVPG